MLTTYICKGVKDVLLYLTARIAADKQLGEKETWMKMVRTEEGKRRISKRRSRQRILREVSENSTLVDT